MAIDRRFFRGLVLTMMAAAILGMFAWSVAYRTAHPSMVVGMDRTGAVSAQEAMSGDPQAMNKVMAAMARLQKNPDDIHAMLEAAEAFMDAKLMDKSLSLIERALSRAPGDLDVLNHYGVALFNADRPAEAAKQFEAMLAKAPDDFRAQYNLATALKHGLGDATKAEGYYRAVIANPKTDPETLERAKRELSDQ